MDYSTTDDPSSQLVPLGSVFIALAIVVWTSVALWLCYSGPLADGGELGGDSGESEEGTGGILGKIANSFADLLDGSSGKEKPANGLPSDPTKIDLRKLEELLTSKTDGALSSLKSGKPLASKPPGKDSSLLGSLPSSGLSKGSAEPLPGNRKSLLEELAGSVSPARSRVDLPDDKNGLAGKREALEEFLKQLVLPHNLGSKTEDRSSACAARFRGKFAEGFDFDPKDASVRPAIMQSMADHAKGIGNKYLADGHFAAAAHCFEVACLLHPASGEGSGELAAYHCNCALACLELGRFGDAINEGNAALVLKPPKLLAVKALYRLAVAHVNLRNLFEARRCLKRCIDLDPANEYARAFLVRLGEDDSFSGGDHNGLPKSPQAERRLTWVEPSKRVQCIGGTAREKAKNRKGKQKHAADDTAAVQESAGADGSNHASGVKVDREAALWHSMAQHGNKVYIMGGWSDRATSMNGPSKQAKESPMSIAGCSAAQSTDEFHVLDVDTFELRQLSSPGSKPPHPCYGHTATMIGANMLVFGGCGPFPEQPPAVMLFDTQAGRWRVPSTIGIPPKQRLGHSATAVQGEKYLCIFGGVEPTSECRVARVYNDVHLLDVQLFSWRKFEVGGNRPAARFGHSATPLPQSPGKMLVMGGRDNLGGLPDPALSQSFTGLHILDTERRVWTEQPFRGAPPTNAFYHTANVLDHKTLMFATSGAQALPLHLLDLETWSWSIFNPTSQQLKGPAPRIGHTATGVGNRVYIFGGVIMRNGHTAVDKHLYVLDTAKPEAPPPAIEKTVSPKLEKPEPQEKMEKLEKTEKPERSGKADKAEKVEKVSHLTPVQNGTGRHTKSEKKINGESKNMTLDKTVEHVDIKANHTVKVASKQDITEPPPLGKVTSSAKQTVAATGADDHLNLLMRDGDFDDDAFDDSPELSFEELLEQEKAFFKAQSERTAFPRARDNASKKNKH